MKTTTVTRLAATLLCATLPAGAATVLNFDSFALGTYQNTFSAGGWTFSAATVGPGPVNLAVEEAGRQSNYAGDRVVSFGFLYVAGSEINSVSIRTQDGSAFKLESISLSDIAGNPDLRIQAYLDGSPTAYSPVDVNIFDTVRNVTFTGWDNFDEIRITNSTGTADLAFDVDDLTVSAAVIPEPASTGLLGLAVLGLFRRRR